MKLTHSKDKNTSPFQDSRDRFAVLDGQKFPNIDFSLVDDEPVRARESTKATSLDSSTTQEDCLPFTVKDKIIISGDSIEHYHFEKPLFARTGDSRRRKLRKKMASFEDFARFERWLNPPVRKFRTTALNRIRRLVTANFGSNSRFFTLTFNNENTFALNDIEKCNYEFKKFIQRLKHFTPGFKYLAVPEFQKRGALHFHLVIDIPYIKQPILARIWRMGFVFIQKLNNTPNIAAYITKYLRKNAEDSRFYGKKTYFASRGLLQPITLYGNEALSILGKSAPKIATYKSSYASLVNGKIDYTQYNVSSKSEQT